MTLNMSIVVLMAVSVYRDKMHIDQIPAMEPCIGVHGYSSSIHGTQAQGADVLKLATTLDKKHVEI
jgi:hypothetical protein